jgi:hypothetical protein
MPPRVSRFFRETGGGLLFLEIALLGNLTHPAGDARQRGFQGT